MSEAIMTFTSHIAGKNATVSIYNDRVEWLRGKAFTAGRAALAVSTGGLSLATKAGRGSSKDSGSEVLYIRSITSVTTKKDGIKNWAVSIIAAGNTVDMRVSKQEAEDIKSLLNRLIAEAHVRA